MKTLILCLAFLLPPVFQDSIEEMLLGKWGYTKGSYEYYSADGHKLKESDMNAISELEIQLNKDNTALISFSQGRSRATTYSVSKDENGKYFIHAALRSTPFKYEISSISKGTLLLLSRTNTSFFIDGDMNKKVSYALVKIQLDRKP